MTRRKQRSCYSCRTRHLKCDGSDPCINCKVASRECKKEEAHIFLNSAPTTVVRQGKQFNLAWGQDFDAAERVGDVRSDPQPPQAVTNGSVASLQSEGIEPQQANPGMNVAPSSTRVPTPDSLSPAVPCLPNNNDNASNPPVSKWRLESHDEALLLRYYVTNLARWFDDTDTQQHFAITLPQMAQECRSLLNAMLAFAAMQLHLEGNMGEAVYLHYIDICYKVLLPKIKEKWVAFAPSALVSVFFLRIMQQMSGEYGDCLGDVFLDALQANINSSIHQTIFVNVLRLYTHLAFANAQPLELVDSACEWICHELPVPQDSRGWEWKALMQCCTTVNFVYGANPKTMERWMLLDTVREGWRVAKPTYFDPIFGDDSAEPFPRIVFAQEIHASAFIYHNLATLLMINNIPDEAGYSENVPSKEQIEKQSYDILRRVCGTAISHAGSVSILLRASLVIFYAGHLLKSRAEQDAAWDILTKGEAKFPHLNPKESWTRLRAAWQSRDEWKPFTHINYYEARIRALRA